MKTAMFAGLMLTLCVSTGAQAESVLERLGWRRPVTNSVSASAAGLSQGDLVGGLKEALSNGVAHAVATLGREDGFLKDTAVRIPMPASLQKVERTLRTLHQESLADDFVVTLNRAAEQAVPEAAGVLGDSVRQMSIADARAILAGTNDAATRYFRQTSETNLYERFLPIVRETTEQTGVTRAYKRMTAKIGGGLGGFGGLDQWGGTRLGVETLDLDNYVTRKTLDGLFVKIAAAEKEIRENPAARTTALLQKAFGARAP